MAGRHLDPTHPGGEENCRACVDFKSWMSIGNMKPKDKAKAGPSTPAAPAAPHTCPLDKDELGRGSWGLLHSIAAYYPTQPTPQQRSEIGAFLGAFSRFYPCSFCAADMRRDLKAEPPQTASRDALAQWLCRLHNNVNRKLGKDEFDCALVQERWRDGWKDGSCG